MNLTEPKPTTDNLSAGFVYSGLKLILFLMGDIEIVHTSVHKKCLVEIYLGEMSTVESVKASGALAINFWQSERAVRLHRMIRAKSL